MFEIFLIIILFFYFQEIGEQEKKFREDIKDILETPYFSAWYKKEWIDKFRKKYGFWGRFFSIE